VKRKSTIVVLAFLLLPGMAWAQSTSSLDTLEKVVVTGEQPGPGLWRVSKGDHVLWIMGTYVLLPKEMTWRSAEVESIIATSQALLMPGGVELDFDAGFFKRIGLVPSIGKARNLPDETTLQSILPSDVYTKWQVLQQKYMPHDTAESVRPPFAAAALLNNARSHSGLRISGDADVLYTLKKLAKQHKLKITTTPVQKVEIKVAGAKDVEEEFSRDPLAGVECFTTFVNRLERHLDGLRALANAWAVGDLGVLRQGVEIFISLRDRGPTVGCVDKLMISGLITGGFEQGSETEAAVQQFERAWALAVQEEARQWLEATESALSKDASTFAVMQIGSLLDPNGYLQKLRERGYSVEQPDGR